MKRLAPFVVLVGAPTSAFAHGGGLPIGPMEVWHHWSFDPWIWAPLLALHWLYGRGVLRAWRRAGAGRVISRGRVACFAGGEILLVAALVSPLDPLGETLLSAHMVQHLLLAAAAPPLLVIGRPGVALLWAAPANWRGFVRGQLARTVAQCWDWLTRPLVATSLHAAAIWVWHAPALFNLALENETAHTLEHISFLATGVMFATAIVGRQTPSFAAALLVLVTFVHMGVLAAILVLAPSPLYAYGDVAMLWGLTALSDQQLAGLIMWAPAGGLYLAAFAALVADSLGEDSRGDSHGIIRASTSSRSMN